MAEEQTVAETEDDFDSAFEALLNSPAEPDQDKEPEAVTEETPEEKEPEPEQDPEPEETTEETTAETTEETPEETGEETGEETVEEKAKREQSEQWAAENRAREEAEKKAAEEEQAAAEAERKEQEEAAAKLGEPGKPSEEEQALLDKFQEEWPDHYPAIKVLLDLQRKESEAKYVKALQSVTERIYSELAPVAETAGATAEQAHFNRIKEAHQDFDAVKAKLGPWIESQPPYLAKAMKTVYTSGNADEVIDLIQRYKDTNGMSSPKPGAEPSTTKGKPVVDQKKLDALESVGSKRTTPQQQGVDVNDFDSAFNEAVANLK